MKLRDVIIWSALSVLPVAHAWASPPDTGKQMSLSEVISISLGGSPAIQEVRANVARADARVDEAEAGRLPTVALSAGVKRTTLNSASPVNSRPVLDFSALAPGLGVVPVDNAPTDLSGYTQYSAGLQGEWMLYDFGKQSNVIDSTSSDLAAEIATEEVTRGQTAVEVVQRYFDVLQAQETVKVREDFLRAKDEAVNLALRLKRAGKAAAGDVARAKSERSQANLDLIEARNQVERLKIALKQEMGISVSMPVNIDPNSRLESPEHWVAMTLENPEWATHHPRVVAGAESVRARRSEIAAQRADYLPTFNAQGSYTVDKFQDASSSPNYSVGVQMRWTLFEGGGRSARVRQAEAQRAAANARRRQVLQSVIGEKTRAQQELTVAEQRIRAAKEAVAAAQEDLRTARAGYREGVGAFADLSDAQIAMREAEVRLSSARFDRQKAIAELYWALGRVPTAKKGSDFTRG